MEHPRILPECFADTLMADMLTGAATAHNRGIDNVFSTLKKFEPKKRKAIGIIDDDKRKNRNPYYKQYKLEEETDCFKLMSHANGHKLIVTYGKGFEVFLKKVAEEADVKHKLLDDLDRLKRLCKSETAKSDPDLKNLLNTLIQKKSKPLMHIKEIITTFTGY